MPLIVHHLQVSQSERIPWLCEELNIPYELKLHQRAPLLSPQSIKDLNPLGQAPVIQDGALTLAESGACVEYIIHKHGNGRLALGPSHKNYADYLYWFHLSNGGLQPAVSRFFSLQMAGVDQNSPVYKNAKNRLDQVLALIDARLAANSYLAGEEFTAADVMSVFSLTTMRTFVSYDLSAYPNTLAYLKRIVEREGYKKARAKADPELEPMIDGKTPKLFVEKLKEQGKM